MLQIHDVNSATEYLAARVNHLNMMDDYRSQHFKTAANACKMLKGEFDGQMDGYYDMWIERCGEMAKNPPDKGWDQVYRTNTK